MADQAELTKTYLEYTEKLALVEAKIVAAHAAREEYEGLMTKYSKIVTRFLWLESTVLAQGGISAWRHRRGARRPSVRIEIGGLVAEGQELEDAIDNWRGKRYVSTETMWEDDDRRPLEEEEGEDIKKEDWQQ